MYSHSIPSISKLPPTLLVTSPLGPCPSPLSHSHSQVGANEFPPLSWSLPPNIASSIRDEIKPYLLVVKDPDAPLPPPVIHDIHYNVPVSKTDVGNEHFVLAKSDETNSRLLAGGFSYGQSREDNLGGPGRFWEMGFIGIFFRWWG